MYGRATRLQIPPDAVEKGIAFFKEKVLPADAAGATDVTVEIFESVAAEIKQPSRV